MICYKERYKRYKKEKRAYLNKGGKSKAKTAAALKKMALKERRDIINNLIRKTGMHYGEVAYYYDSGKIDELYKRAEYLKSIGKIKPNNGERKMVKSIVKGSPDYFIISTI
nr:MAG TPA: hypothetical protein [Caudoviricetes sp.]